MEIKHTVINANDNSLLLGSAYYGNDKHGSKLRNLSHRDWTLFLIEKYASPAAKTSSSELEFLEAGIVGFIDMAARYFERYGPCSTAYAPVALICVLLKVDPLKLYNDPDLPEFLRGAQIK